MDQYYEDLRIHVHAEQMGEDLCVSIYGGDLPHIGSISIAVPRESLKQDGSPSATVSTFNHTGHKDHEVSDPVAFELSKQLGIKTVAVCGIHYDSLSDQLLEKIKLLRETIVKDILENLKQ